MNSDFLNSINVEQEFCSIFKEIEPEIRSDMGNLFFALKELFPEGKGNSSAIDLRCAIRARLIALNALISEDKLPGFTNDNSEIAFPLIQAASQQNLNKECLFDKDQILKLALSMAEPEGEG